MRKTVTIIIAALLICGFFPNNLTAAGFYWDFPPLPPPHEYGSLLINRLSTENQVQPVYFPHWRHRVRYTCRVCHFELDFELELGKTEITEEDNRNGLFCGTCHDGKVAFGHTEGNCARCHTGSVETGKKDFEQLAARLPEGFFGNVIDWGKAVDSGAITPIYSIFHPEERPLDFEKILSLDATWNFVPPAIFPHKAHTRWLDCANCHPDIFNIKKKTTENFAMDYILDRKFCGACHMNVAFPLDDCTGCHPKIKRVIP